MLQGIPTPPARLFPAGIQDGRALGLSFPLVIKPRDGAGSLATRLVRDPGALATCVAGLRNEYANGEWIAQPYVVGLAASVVCLVDSQGPRPLPPAAQELSSDDRFSYRGGSLPLSADLADRASQLACRAVQAIKGLRGYVGVDLVLGERQDGEDDYVIEINPRLTTSYLGLRAVCRQNLANAILAACLDEPRPALSWKPLRLHLLTSTAM